MKKMNASIANMPNITMMSRKKERMLTAIIAPAVILMGMVFSASEIFCQQRRISVPST